MTPQGLFAFLHEKMGQTLTEMTGEILKFHSMTWFDMK
jgi:hypothetical protein